MNESGWFRSGVWRSMYIVLILSGMFASSIRAQDGGDNLIVNGGFEEVRDDQPAGWNRFWMRDDSVGELSCDTQDRHSGRYSVRIDHRGQNDWSLNYGRKFGVETGDLFELSAWIKTDRRGSAVLCVTSYDADNKAIDWSYGERSIDVTGRWDRIITRFVIAEGTASIQPRVIGYGPATVRIDDVSMVKKRNINEGRGNDIPATVTIANRLLSVSVNTKDTTIAVTDKRTGQTVKQQPLVANVVMEDIKADGNIEITWLDASSGNQYRTAIALERNSAEFVVSISFEGQLERSLLFPHPFVTEPGTSLIVPMNEGISYPVEDESINTMKLIAYGGHGICMPFWGATDGKAGYMAIIETADDASIRIERYKGKLCIAPEWDSQKGMFGYTRRLRYVFFDEGGHVAMCKRYREYAKATGLFKNLKEKRRENPNVDLLIGAVNVWCWQSNELELIKEMKELGIERILWSHRSRPETIQAMNRIEGVLSSRYDIYQDLMDPEIVKTKLRGSHSDWTQAGWPDDLMIDERGNRENGWQVKGKDGNMYPCGVLCDMQAVEHSSKRIPDELKTHAYRSRFIDTTTASPWRECYHPDHPMTRSDSRRWKMELLRYMSEEMKLVTGSETGHDAAVPYVHYFEGMLSLGPYRVPDAGRNMIQPVSEVPERVAKFQVGHKYRLPLWELVYHDCVVAQWYWGDYNNKLPALWDKRDLFNILYGTPPMFMYNDKIWREHKERFAQSYKDVCPVVRSVGYAEMTDHRFLTDDKSVQQTAFDNGIRITVNFGENPFRSKNGINVPPGGFHVEN